jgi:hypothetical protein
MKEVTTELERVIQKGSNVQQDSQENENIMADLSMQYTGDAFPTSIKTCDFSNSSSSDADLLIIK